MVSRPAARRRAGAQTCLPKTVNDRRQRAAGPFTGVAGGRVSARRFLLLAVRRAALFLVCYSWVPGTGLNLIMRNANPTGSIGSAMIISESARHRPPQVDARRHGLSHPA